MPRERIVGIKQVTINEHFFQGHFPEMPVMPGVLQIEALAQVGAILVLREFEDRANKIPFFSGHRQRAFSPSGRSGRYINARSYRAPHGKPNAKNARHRQS